MEEKVFNIATEIKDDTYYRYDGASDIYLSDTKRISDKIYLSQNLENFGYLDTAFYIKGVKNSVIDFCGIKLTLHGRIEPFIFDECENVTIKNVSVEYDRSFFSEFEIISNENGILKLKKSDKFPCRTEDGCLIPYSDTWECYDLSKKASFMQVFDKETGDGRGLALVAIAPEKIELPDFPYYFRCLTAEEDDNAIILTGDIPKEWDNTMTATIEHEFRDKTNISICRSKNFTIENYRIINGCGMGVFAMYTENLTIDGLLLKRDELSHGWIANSADAMHLVACIGKLEIKNCDINGTIDDVMNVHSNYLIVKGIDGSTVTAYRYEKSHALTADFKFFDKDDKIAVYFGNSNEKKFETTVKSVSQIDTYNFLIELQNTEGISLGDTIENLRTNPELYMHDCNFGKTNTHMRIQTGAKSLVENCEISVPVYFSGDKEYWYECSAVKDLTIRNCRFKGNRGQIWVCPDKLDYTENEPYYHKNILVENCTFEASDALRANRVENVKLKNCSSETGEKLTAEITDSKDVIIEEE